MIRLTSAVGRLTNRMSRLLLALLAVFYLGAVLLTYFDYLEPYLLPLHLAKNSSMTVDGKLLFGSYPDYEEIRRLKKMRATVLISLLNTSLPQERALFEKEQRNAGSIGGIEVHSFPLNYLNMDGEHNSLVIERLVDFLRNHKDSRIYIHCYLGRHRVGLVRKKLLESGVNNALPRQRR